MGYAVFKGTYYLFKVVHFNLKKMGEVDIKGIFEYVFLNGGGAHVKSYDAQICNSIPPSSRVFYAPSLNLILNYVLTVMARFQGSTFACHFED